MALLLAASSLIMLGLGAAFWFGAFHLGRSDHVVGVALVVIGVLDAILSMVFMNR